MSQQLIPIMITFCGYGLIIYIIATIASRSTHHLSDFVLAGRKLSGPVTALGAGASDMSSWLLMALPGSILSFGLSMAWMPLALTVGAYLNWRYVAKRLRIYTQLANDSLTIPAFFSNRFANSGKSLRMVTSAAIIIFFTFYSVAGFVSGALLVQLTFGIGYSQALLISAITIIAYTAIGGFLAVSWVDFFQGSLMLFALILVPVVTIGQITPLSETWQHLALNNPKYFDVLDGITLLGMVSLFAWGLGYFGQPHIIVRFMAIRSAKELPIARHICMSWMILAMLGAMAIGIIGYGLFHESPLEKNETIFLVLADKYFNPWLNGILLSAVLSSIMSTVSALILMSASALVEDFYHAFIQTHASDTQYIWANRLGIILIAGFAVWIASNPNVTVLNSVAFPWCGLGASFGPAMLFSLYWRRMTYQGAITGIASGALFVLLFEWLQRGGYTIASHPDFLPGFSILPGFIISALMIILVSLKTQPPQLEVTAIFDKMEKEAAKYN